MHSNQEKKITKSDGILQVFPPYFQPENHKVHLNSHCHNKHKYPTIMGSAVKGTMSLASPARIAEVLTPSAHNTSIIIHLNFYYLKALKLSILKWTHPK